MKDERKFSWLRTGNTTVRGSVRVRVFLLAGILVLAGALAGMGADDEKGNKGPKQAADPASAPETRYSKPSDAELKARLTPMQYNVTQEDGTERPFENAYWDNHQEGIYVDVVSGEPVFSSRDKFDSGTGWPSFTKPLVQDHIVQHKDYKLWLPRTEVRSKYGDSHLGHVFTDGPQPTGLRYCINSASLRFIPKADLEKQGYGKYVSLFDKE